MNSLTKKIGVAIIGLSMIVMIAPGASQALTSEELQAQITSLTATLAQLQAQLAQLQGQPTTPSGAVPAACVGITFTRSLSQGSTGSDVKCLQAILNQSSDTRVAASGVGSAGNETTYFGSLTKAAVVKFQEKYASEILATYGLTTGTGFVGATTKAKLNSLLTGGVQPPPGTVCGNGVCESGENSANCVADCPTVPPPSGALSVSLAPDTPAAGTIITDDNDGAQALIPFMKLNFSAGSAQVTSIKVKRLGISSDSDIKNAYLYDGNTKIAEMASLSIGVVTFSNSAGLFNVSGTKVVTLKVDIATTTSGKTMGFSLLSAADVTSNAIVSGVFPISGNLMTTAVVSDLGKLAVATTSNAATIDPGTSGFEAFRITLTSSNQNIDVYSLTFLQLGSISKTDIQNMALYDGATQLGSTIANLASDGTATFDLSSSPYRILAGMNRTLSLKVNIIGGSTRTIQFSLQRSSDVVAKDVNYGVNIAPYTSAVGTFSVLNSTATTINSGNLVISRSTDSPTGNVALNGINIPLAKFDVTAVGESIKVSYMGIAIATSTGNFTTINNVKLLYDGSQIGVTQTTMAPYTTSTLTVSFIVAPGSTHYLQINADIQGTGVGATDAFKGQLAVGSSNAQRMVSLGTFNFPSSIQEGTAVTVASGALSAVKNQSVGSVSVVNGQTNTILGSYLLTAGSAEGVDVSKITFTDTANSTSTAGSQNLGAAFTNLKAMYGSTQLGTTIVPNQASPANTYDFYPSPALSLAAGQTIRVDLIGDVNTNGSSNWTTGDTSAIEAIEGRGKVTGTTANASSTGQIVTAVGQIITVSSAGTLSASVDPSTPISAIVPMGVTGQTLGAWKLSANTIEDLTVSKIYVYNANASVASSSGNVKNLQLFCDSLQYGPTADGLVSGAAVFGYYTGGNTCIIPKGGYKSITLKADMTNYTDNSTGVGQYVNFYITVPASPMTGASTESITARGASTYANTSGAGNYTANAQYPYRTSLTANYTVNGSATGRTRSATDKVANLAMTATGGSGAVFQVATDISDESNASWTATSTSTTGGANGSVATSTLDVVDGTYAIRYTEASTSTVGDGIYYDFGAAGGLQNFTKLSFWASTTQGKAAADMQVRVSPTSTYLSLPASSTLASNFSAAMTAKTWTYIEISLTGLSASDRYIGFMIAANGDNQASTSFDAIRLYNDSITVNITGNNTTTYPTTPVYLKTTGGTTMAVGYYDPTNSKAVLVPSTEIDVGSTPLALEMVTDTTKIYEFAVSGISRTLTFYSSLGTIGTANSADIRWWDQGVAATAPITYLNGASPISVTISTSQGN